MRPRQFRLVDDVVTADPAPATSGSLAEELGGLHALVSPRYLVPASEWRGKDDAAATASVGAIVHCRAEVPLIASLARIRSEADAALALTGVIELLARRFHISLPCASAGEDSFAFMMPESVDFNQVADAIDDSLLGIVRATDLQGALRERCRARIERVGDAS